jgi:CheY-like chemotaxis protein
LSMTRVLVVDDDPTIQRAVAELLEDEGYVV